MVIGNQTYTLGGEYRILQLGKALQVKLSHEYLWRFQQDYSTYWESSHQDLNWNRIELVRRIPKSLFLAILNGSTRF